MATKEEKDDFFAALGGLAGAIKTTRYNNSLQAFQEQKDSIKNSLQPEADKRALQTSLAENAFNNALSFGKDAQTASIMAAQYAPKSYSNLEAALLSGDPAAQAAAQEIQNQAETRTINAGLRQFNNQMAMQNDQQSFLGSEGDKNRANAFKKASLDAANKSKTALKPLVSSQLTQITAGDSNISKVNKLLALLKSNPSVRNAIGPLGHYTPDALLDANTVKDRAAIMEMFQELRQEKSGSAFGVEENKEYKNSIPNESDRFDVLEAKLTRRAKILMEGRASFLDNLRKNNQDVSGWLDTDVSSVVTPVVGKKVYSNEATQKASKYLVRRTK